MEKNTNWQVLVVIIISIIALTFVSDAIIQRSFQTHGEILPQLRRWNFITGGVVAVLLGLIFTFLHFRITKPLSNLSDSIKRIIDGEGEDLELIPHGYELDRLSLLIEVLIRVQKLELQDLASERDTLRYVLDQITDGIVMVNERGEVSSLNPAAEDIFQITSEDAEGRSVAEVLRQHQWIELWRTCIETDMETSATLELPTQKTFIQGIGIPLGESLPGYSLLLFHNLSHIRRLETTRQDFISNISHELRTPLASLKALTDTLQEGALEDPKTAKRFLSRMETELDALTQMVAELLELSRIESGRVPLELRDVLPAEMLSLAYERMRTQADRKMIKVEMETDPNITEIEADPRRVEQVLVNLLHNAIKFSENEGTISLVIKNQPDTVEFSVQDHGPGISENDLERIFERFYKTDQARSGGGTGLGLSIAKHIVENHGGQIWVESIQNEGSTFYFSLPKIQTQDVV
jgi:two-component system phosphate regulon sensor histidine kinase PhoR